MYKRAGKMMRGMLICSRLSCHSQTEAWLLQMGLWNRASASQKEEKEKQKVVLKVGLNRYETANFSPFENPRLWWTWYKHISICIILAKWLVYVWILSLFMSQLYVSSLVISKVNNWWKATYTIMCVLLFNLIWFEDWQNWKGNFVNYSVCYLYT